MHSVTWRPVTKCDVYNTMPIPQDSENTKEDEDTEKRFKEPEEVEDYSEIISSGSDRDVVPIDPQYCGCLHKTTPVKMPI